MCMTVQIPLPRKGTETMASGLTIGLTSSRVQIPLPRKGTETFIGTKVTASASSNVQIPLPRKGTETIVVLTQDAIYNRFKFHYPARGRKLIGLP